MPKTVAEQIVDAYKDGMNELSSYRGLVETCARYFRPTYTDLTQDPSEADIALPNTSAGIEAQQKFSAGVYSNTISLGRGVLESENPTLRDSETVQRFFSTVSEKANDLVRIGFPKAYRECVDDYGLAAAFVLYVHFDEDEMVHEFIPYNPMDCVWYEDKNGVANKMLRGFEYTADQAVEAFGFDKVGAKVQEAWNDESKANKKFKYIHAQRPRKNRDKDKKDDLNMPYESIYVEVDSKKVVKEGGVQRFRYIVPIMFKRRGLRTGFSPAMQSLPSMRTLVRGTDDFYDAIEFKTNPVMFMGDRESVDNAQDLSPGDVRYARLTESPFLYGNNGDPVSIDQMNEILRQEINTLHFLDLFNALEQFKTGERTAYEVAAIIAEKVNLIAPVIHPLKDQCFSPMFEIIAEDIIQYGLINEPIPEELTIEGNNRFKVIYTSRIDARMSGVETENLLFAVQEMLQIEAGLSQTIHSKAKFKISEVLSEILKRRNISPMLTNDKNEYEKALAEIQQAMAQAAAQEKENEAIGRRDIQKAPEQGSEQDIITRAQANVNV